MRNIKATAASSTIAGSLTFRSGILCTICLCFGLAASTPISAACSSNALQKNDLWGNNTCESLNQQSPQSRCSLKGTQEFDEWGNAVCLPPARTKDSKKGDICPEDTITGTDDWGNDVCQPS